MYGPAKRHLSALHDNFDPSCFHTPVSDIVQQQLGNTLTQSWYVDEVLGCHFNPQISALAAAYDKSFQTSLDGEVWISHCACCAVLAV